MKWTDNGESARRFEVYIYICVRPETFKCVPFRVAGRVPKDIKNSNVAIKPFSMGAWRTHALGKGILIKVLFLANCYTVLSTYQTKMQSTVALVSPAPALESSHKVEPGDFTSSGGAVQQHRINTLVNCAAG